jgi:hypothetical protein
MFAVVIPFYEVYHLNIMPLNLWDKDDISPDFYPLLIYIIDYSKLLPRRSNE